MLRDWIRAVEDARRCLVVDPSFAKGYLRLAESLRHMGETVEAIEVVRRGLEVDPSSKHLLKLFHDL